MSQNERWHLTRTDSGMTESWGLTSDQVGHYPRTETSPESIVIEIPAGTSEGEAVDLLRSARDHQRSGRLVGVRLEQEQEEPAHCEAMAPEHRSRVESVGYGPDGARWERVRDALHPDGQLWRPIPDAPRGVPLLDDSIRRALALALDAQCGVCSGPGSWFPLWGTEKERDQMRAELARALSAEQDLWPSPEEVRGACPECGGGVDRRGMAGGCDCPPCPYCNGENGEHYPGAGCPDA